MIGPEINSLCILFGAVIGSFVGRLLGETFRRHLLLVFGCINIGMGIFMIGKTQALPPVVCALLLGALAGEMLRLEHIIMLVAHKTASAFSRIGKKQRSSLEYMREQFSIFLVVFAASGLGFFGAMQEGLTKAPSLLIIKALLDFPTALFIAANTGAIIGVLCVPQFLVQTLVLLSAGVVGQYTSPFLLDNFSGCGVFIMLATGLRTCGIMQFPILSMLPAFLFSMPLSLLWLRFFA